MEHPSSLQHAKSSQLWYMGSSSLIRDQTWASSIGSVSLSHWATREVPNFLHHIFKMDNSFIFLYIGVSYVKLGWTFKYTLSEDCQR